jgi:hypothetical protein
VPTPLGEGIGDLLRPDVTGEPGTATEAPGGPAGGSGGGGAQQSDSGTLLEPSPTGNARGTRASEERRPRPRGGFRVDFEQLGEAEYRAKYSGEDRVIRVNLDHDQIKAALGEGGTENITFRRLSYEIAFTEYAIALASELVSIGDFFEPSDAIFEIRSTINRMARRGASLYGEGAPRK